MERFYLTSEEYLSGEEHHHLSRVMRLREGEEIELVNGLGSLQVARIVKIDKEKTHLQILREEKTESPKVQILAGVPLMRPSKLELVIEKGTELGADSFFLYSADRSTQESLSAHQMDRLRAITIASLKQSKRLFLPHLEILPDISSVLSKQAKIFFGDPRASAGFKGPFDETTLFITGPESGFSEKEMTLLQEKAQGVRLSANVLRAETAPIVALSLLGVFSLK